MNYSDSCVEAPIENFPHKQRKLRTFWYLTSRPNSQFRMITNHDSSFTLFYIYIEFGHARRFSSQKRCVKTKVTTLTINDGAKRK